MFPDHLIIDFDSTFITKESLDELAHAALKDHPEKSDRLGKIEALTNAGMAGEIAFDESLSRRMVLLEANRENVREVTWALAKKVTPSFEKNKNIIRKYSERILIISGGFREMIIPIVSEFGIPAANVFANEFIYDGDGCITQVDAENVMAQSGGKVAQAKELGLAGVIHIIGDGFTDYQLKSEGPASRFYAFVENVQREKVCSLADGILHSFDEYLEIVLD